MSLIDYDPSAPGVKGSIFGLPHSIEESEIVILPVPWDVTTSYYSGASQGPLAILNASLQLDLELPNYKTPWKRGIFMEEVNSKVSEKGRGLRQNVEQYISALESGGKVEGFIETLTSVNEACDELNGWVKDQTLNLLKSGKRVGILGGDHACPLGYIEALTEIHDEFGILQIDAHMDLRKAYECFTYSHASIMYNALQLTSVSKLVQVGIRDYCEEELAFVEKDHRITVFYDQVIKSQLYKGSSWDDLVHEMIEKLPRKVYISFDIDGLNPHLCPGTGTPVPGGLEFAEAVHLFEAVVASGKEIIGFDLCEVAPRPDDMEWNANVGARMLYQLCAALS